MTIALTPPPHTRKKRGQGGERRGEILAAAKRIFLEDGVEHATMRRIAGAVGVSATALYVYFPDKAAILRAMAEATFSELLAALQAADRPTDPVLLRLQSGLSTYVAFARARPDEYRIIFAAKQQAVATGMFEPIAPAEQSFGMLRDIIALGVAEGGVRAGDPTLLAEGMWVAVHGLVTMLNDHCPRLTCNEADLERIVLDLLIAGATQNKPC